MFLKINELEACTQSLIKDIEYVVSHISKQETSNLLACMEDAQRIFIYGSGRSGLIGQAFAMRLVHLGKQVYFVGDSTTPPIKKDDLLIVISNSGKTPCVKSISQIARSQQAQVVSIIGNPHSPVGQLASFHVELFAPGWERRSVPGLICGFPGLGVLAGACILEGKW